MNAVVEGFQPDFGMDGEIFSKRVDGDLDRVSAFQGVGLRRSPSSK